MVEKTIRILAIVPYREDFCAGQRFRIELWASRLADRGIEVEYLPFADQKLTDVLYQPGKTLQKGTLMLRAFVNQLTSVLRAKKPDVIFVYREAALIGPAIIENIVRRWNVPLIYDIDEPHFVPYISPANGSFSKLRFVSKFDGLLRMSDTVFAVNEAIGDYARKFNKNTLIVPMTVDVERYKPSEKHRDTREPKIAWVGTWSNQPNVELAVPAMRQLRKDLEFTFRIVADTPMAFEGLNVDFVQWSYDIEVPKLNECDIGLVPVKKSDWSPWKFFFKTIQFMGLGMPIVATPTGSNLEIIKDGVNGFFAETEKDWYDKLKLLIENPSLRQEMGSEARKTVVEKYNIERQCDFLETELRRLVKQKSQ